MIEVTMAMAVCAIVGTAASTMLAGTSSSNDRTREGTLAAEAAQGVLEELMVLPREEVFARYNAVAADDPAAGASPGPAFDVAGLDPAPEDPDGRVGAVEFPGDGTELREDVDLRELGMPRDLNADGLIDAADHALDAKAVPVRVTVTYQGRSGARTVSFVTLL